MTVITVNIYLYIKSTTEEKFLKERKGITIHPCLGIIDDVSVALQASSLSVMARTAVIQMDGAVTFSPLSATPSAFWPVLTT